MNNYITGTVIKKLREKKKMTQSQLAEQLCVSDKTISKWETCKGFPDISLLEPLAQALHISIPELLAGEQIINTNRAANILRSAIYVCPICGNILHTAGNAMVSCCGITLPPLEAEEADAAHAVQCERIEHELYVTSTHEMTKQHYISFIAYVTANRFELVKQYPEGNAEARFFARGRGRLYWYCNHHGLFSCRV
ncbi:MAG: helix-turn-helix domain-containing protein [Eubacteriales bacterium]|nr:helix-turn-helix domain-containing protein [Eubacteriales bacterium]